MTQIICREKLIVRVPYKRLSVCLNTLKKAMREVGFSEDEINDFLESKAYNEYSGNLRCGFAETASDFCLRDTIEECILKGGYVEYKEWCFEGSKYKLGIEVDCSAGKIYVFKCEEK